jgi:hypothetical protein
MSVKVLITGIILIVVPLFLLFGGIPASQISIQGDVFVDEREYLGLDGKTYGHNIVVPLPSGSDSPSPTSSNINSQRTNNFLIGFQGNNSVTVNTRFQISGTHGRTVSLSRSSHFANAQLKYDDKSFITPSLSFSYGIVNGVVEQLTEKPIRYASDGTIYIEAMDRHSFKVGCTYLNNICFGDMRPPASYEVPCVESETDKVISWNSKAFLQECGSTSGVAGWDYINSGAYTYYSPTRVVVGQCDRDAGWSYWEELDRGCALYSRTSSGVRYKYGGLLAPYNDVSTVRIAFNVPDSDGDGVDDLDDLAPNNANISTLIRAQEELSNLDTLVDQKQKEYNDLIGQIEPLEREVFTLQSNIYSNELTISQQTQTISSLTSDIENKSVQLGNINQELQIGITHLVRKQKELQALQKLSNNITFEIETNVEDARRVYNLFSNTTSKFELEVDSLQSQLEMVNWDGQEQLRDNVFSIVDSIRSSIQIMKGEQKQIISLIDTIDQLVKEKEQIELSSQSKITELEGVIATQTALITSQEVNILDLVNVAQSLNNQIDIHQTTITKNKNKIKELNTAILKIGELELEKISIQEQLTNAQIDQAKAETLIDIINSDIRAIEDRFGITADQMSTKVIELAEDNQELELKILELEGTLISLYEENKSLQDRVNIAKAFNKVLIGMMVVGVLFIGFYFVNRKK